MSNWTITFVDVLTESRLNANTSPAVTLVFHPVKDVYSFLICPDKLGGKVNPVIEFPETGG
jgi:hypothetical protein